MAMLQRIGKDPERRRLTLRYLANGKEGLLAFARDWCWTYDPRAQGKMPKRMPYTPWKRHIELLSELYDAEAEQRPLFIEKSRDVGVTWTVAGVYFVWRWLFTPGWTGTIGSRKLDLLDKEGDPKSTFEKVRTLIRCLPKWMRPVGFALNNSRYSAYCRLINPANGAFIGGEGGPDMGRGGRSSMYMIDEWGFVSNADAVLAAVSENTKVIIYATTSTGPETRAAKMRNSGAIRLFRFHWSDDPRRPKNYRDEYARKFGEEIAAHELDISWEQVGTQIFIPRLWLDACVNFAIDPRGAKVGGMDVADSGTGETVLVYRHGAVVSWVRAWSNIDTGESSRRVVSELESEGAEYLFFDATGVGAGVKGGVDTIERYREERNQTPLSFTSYGVHVGVPATKDRLTDDGRERECRDRFSNLKAEMWWRFRVRVERTYQRVMGIQHWPDEECVSLPADEKLLEQLSTPRITMSTAGLVAVESKDSLARRGIPSPDRADALILAFYPHLPARVAKVTQQSFRPPPSINPARAMASIWKR